MGPSDIRQKLTAVMAADVVGYSRLMGENPHATLATLTQFREVFQKHVSGHLGRIVNAPGDSILAEFESVVDAVACAVEVQQDLAGHNDALPAQRQMRFRIGVNLGDVLVWDGDLYGDGVNIAARLESLADPGGICVSRTVYEQIRNRLPLAFEDLGDKSVKNIAEPVWVYKVFTEGESRPAAASSRGIAGSLSRRNLVTLAGVAAVGALVVAGLLIWRLVPPASLTSTVSPPVPAPTSLPDKPSIAVLPFQNLSGDPKQNFFGEGLSEDIITRFANINALFTISRNSSFSYKGKAVMIRQIGQELGVRYVLEGSVQKSGERFRVTAQLIDAVTGNHRWAERYDRDLKEFFTVQDEISTSVVLEVLKELEVKPSPKELAPLRQSATDNFAAWEFYAKAMEQFRRYNYANMYPALWGFQNALKLDPEFEPALLGIGWIKLFDGIWETLGTQSERNSYLEQAADLANRALVLNDTLGEPHALLGQVALWKRMHDLAIEEGKKSIALNPNNSLWHAYLANSLSFAGFPGEALGEMVWAMRLDPFPPDFVLSDYARILYESARYEEALAIYEDILKRHSDHLGGKGLQLGKTAGMMSIAISAAAGLPDARRKAADYNHQSPEWLVPWHFPYKNGKDAKRIFDDLAKVGLK